MWVFVVVVVVVVVVTSSVTVESNGNLLKSPIHDPYLQGLRLLGLR